MALVQIDRALEINPSDADNFAYRGTILTWSGRPADALPWLEGALRFDRGNAIAAGRLCMAYYLLRRYADASEACIRSLSNNPGRSDQMLGHPTLAAAYAEAGLKADADAERGIAMRLWPLFDAQAFAAQFGTEEAQAQMLDGLRKAGFD